MGVMGNIEAEARRAAGFAEREMHQVEDLFARHQTPATTPASTATTTTEENVSLTTLEDDVKNDLTQGLDWLDGFVTRVKAAAPGIIATSEAVGGSTVGKLVEIAAGKILPPGVEDEFLALAERYFGSFGQAAAATVPVAPQAPPAQ
jgi:hypothetical protein